MKFMYRKLVSILLVSLILFNTMPTTLVSAAALDDTGGSFLISAVKVDVDKSEISAVVSASDACFLKASVFEDIGADIDWNGPAAYTGTVEIDEAVDAGSFAMDVSATLPVYFIVLARLSDKDGNDLCEPFLFVDYSREYRKTVNDFPKDNVIQLDESENNNFLVLADDVEKINVGEALTEVAGNVYVFNNAGSEVSSLNVGDKVAVVGVSESDIHMVEVQSITQNGSEVTVVSNSEPDATSFYSYIKIDMVSDTVEVEMSGNDPGVELISGGTGVPDMVGDSGGGTVGGETDDGKPLEWSFDVSPIDEIELKGSIKADLKSKVKFDFVPVVTWNYTTIPIVGTKIPTTPKSVGFNPCQANLSIIYDFEISGGLKYTSVTTDQYRPKTVLNSIPIKITDKLTFPIAPLITVKAPIVLPIGWDAECEASFTHTITGESGFEYNGKSHKFINEKETNTTFDIDGRLNSLHIGIKISPSLVLGLDKGYGSLSLKANITTALNVYVGLEITGVNSGYAEDPRHYCESCIDGAVYLLGELWFDIKINVGIGPLTIPAYTLCDETLYMPPRTRLLRFYCSLKNSQDSIFKGMPSGLKKGVCPNRESSIDFSAIQPVLVNKTDDAYDYECAIDLYNESLVIIGYDIKAYSLDGGNKWKKAKSATFTDEKFPKLLNKGMTLWLSDKEIEKSTKKPPEDANIVKFDKIEERPKAPKVAVNYALEENSWVLVDKKSGQQLTAGDMVEVGVVSGKTVGNYSEFYSGLVEEISGKKVSKTKYQGRYAPVQDGSVFIPASKPAKVTVSSELKAPKYKIKTNKKTGEKTIKLKANTCVNGTKYTSKTVLDLSEYMEGDIISIWTLPTAKKPASAIQTIVVS